MVHGKPYNIRYYVYFYCEEFLWLFENNEADKNLISTFTYTLNNLELSEPSTEEGNQWQINLAPGEKRLLRMKRKDANKETGYSTKAQVRVK